MESKPIKLNLGCSSYVRGYDWTNVDCRRLYGVDVVCDLNDAIWPWDSNSVDEIHASHILEHLDDPLHAILEMWRILKPDGVIHVRTPNASGYLAHAIGHKSCLSRDWFNDLHGNANHQNDTGRLFRQTSFEFRIFPDGMQGLFSRTGNWLIRAIERYGNRTPERQLLWEVSGLCVPSEIRWTANGKVS
jgi:predicted SAM-dependent methyltransferase